MASNSQPVPTPGPGPTVTPGPDGAAVARPMDPRTRRLLEGPVVVTLLTLAWPNILVMLAQASTGLIETWWVAHLGTAALAGMALVFPGFMLMQMLSGGAMGGGISSAIARALGAGRRADADALVVHALLINLLLGVLTSAIFLVFGRWIYSRMGGEGDALDAALTYSNIVFVGNIAVWLMNAVASILRGTGNMLVPSLVIIVGVVLLIPLSPLLIFGWGPLPALGVAGAGIAVVATTTLSLLALAGYLLSGRSVVRLTRVRLQWSLFAAILKVGAVASLSSLQTALTVALTTGLVAAVAGSPGVAGYGTGARLEYLLIPLVFGLGAPLVALVGTHIGAGQPQRALRVALIGGGIAFVLCETVGVLAALFPAAWLGLFDSDPQVIEAGASYLRIVGPTYGFFGLGLCLYFASQGAGKLGWPIAAGLARLLIAVVAGWIAATLTGSLDWVFAALALALVIYGASLALAVAGGVWFPKEGRAAMTGRGRPVAAFDAPGSQQAH